MNLANHTSPFKEHRRVARVECAFCKTDYKRTPWCDPDQGDGCATDASFQGLRGHWGSSFDGSSGHWTSQQAWESVCKDSGLDHKEAHNMCDVCISDMVCKGFIDDICDGGRNVTAKEWSRVNNSTSRGQIKSSKSYK